MLGKGQDILASGFLKITFLSTLKLVLSAIPLNLAQESGWDQLLYVITELPVNFFDQLQGSISYVWEHAMSDILLLSLFSTLSPRHLA